MLYPPMHFAYAICSNSTRLVALLPIQHEINVRNQMQILFFTCHSVFHFSLPKMTVSELNKLEISTSSKSTQCYVFTFNIYLCYHLRRVILMQQRQWPILKRLKRSFIYLRKLGLRSTHRTLHTAHGLADYFEFSNNIKKLNSRRFCTRFYGKSKNVTEIMMRNVQLLVVKCRDQIQSSLHALVQTHQIPGTYGKKHCRQIDVISCATFARKQNFRCFAKQ